MVVDMIISGKGYLITKDRIIKPEFGFIKFVNKWRFCSV